MSRSMITNDQSSKFKTDTLYAASALTLLAAFFWGTSFPVIELGLEIIDPFWFAQLRFLIASLGSLVVVHLYRKRISHSLITNPWIWCLGLFNALGFIAQFFAQTLTTATKTALLINLNLVTVAILSSLLFSEQFSKKKYIAILLSITGVFLLTTGGDISALISGEFLGDMVALCAGFAWAFYIITNKKVVSSPKMEVIPLVACVMLTTSLFMIPFTIFFGGLEIGKINIGFSGLGFILYIGIFCNVIPFVLWTSGLKRLQPTVSSLFMLFEVFIAAILAMLFLYESLTFVGLLGGLIIVFAIIIISMDTKNSTSNR